MELMFAIELANNTIVTQLNMGSPFMQLVIGAKRIFCLAANRSVLPSVRPFVSASMPSA